MSAFAGPGGGILEVPTRKGGAGRKPMDGVQTKSVKSEEFLRSLRASASGGTIFSRCSDGSGLSAFFHMRYLTGSQPFPKSSTKDSAFHFVTSLKSSKVVGSNPGQT